MLSELVASVGALSIILFIVGLGLIIAEIFFIPGFGITGIAGIIILVIDVFVTAKSVYQGLLLTGIFAFVVFAFVLLGSFMISKGIVPQRLVLKDSTDKASGYSGASERPELLGENGVTITELRPAGCALINGERTDVVSNGEFIEKGCEITVARVEGNRTVVARRV